MWYCFTFETGSNPYIAKTEEERDRVIRQYKRRKIEVTPCSAEGHFFVHNKEAWEKEYRRRFGYFEEWLAWLAANETNNA